MRLLMTGAAGYVGGFLLEHFVARTDVEVVAVDRRPLPWPDSANNSVNRLVGDLADRRVLRQIEASGPFDAVIHAAFDMKAGYKSKAIAVARNNHTMCENVFRFAFESRVKTLVYFSSASVYGALPGNRATNLFREDAELRETEYPYGCQKVESEHLLRRLYETHQPTTTVAILRPCSITGPTRNRAGTKTVSLIAFLRDRLPFVPEVSREWARQFVHEADIVAVVERIVDGRMNEPYAVFNVAPADYALARDIARALGTRVIPLPAWLMNAAFFLAWHGTRGAVPTPPGSIRFYKYPINLDASKLRELEVNIARPSLQALLATK
jgi:nucleoside-diphosphate-sugar epimerase